MNQTETNTATVCDEQFCEQQTHTKLSDTTYRPPVDMYELRDRYEIHVELPGTDPDSIELTVQDGELEIMAQVPHRYLGEITPLHREYGVGNYKRVIRLGEDIDTESLDASYEAGVLIVTLPKQAQRQPRRVQVRGG